MKAIELSISTAMSLNVNSRSSSEDEEIEADEPALSMSDEEFENMTDEEVAEVAFIDDSDEDDDEEDYEDDEPLGDDDEDEYEDEADQEDEDSAAEEDESEEAEDEYDSEEDQPSEEGDVTETNAYKEVYNQLFGQPIKASGREFQLRDATQARNLIEMGVDYNKKMQHMKPYLPVLKTLEKKGMIQDVEKLNLALEVLEGNPNAIKRIIAEKELDVLDLADGVDEGQTYKPENHIMPEAEYRIEEALSAIRESPVYDKTINVMANQFDNQSKKIIADNPDYITALNGDIETGLYDRVMENVQYKRDTRLIPESVSDIEAYIDTVKEMAQYEMQYAQQAQQQQAQVQQNQQVSQQSDERKKRSNRRKTGMSSSRSRKKTVEPNFDPLSMSDEDFMKIDGIDIL